MLASDVYICCLARGTISAAGSAEVEAARTMGGSAKRTTCEFGGLATGEYTVVAAAGGAGGTGGGWTPYVWRVLVKGLLKIVGTAGKFDMNLHEVGAVRPRTEKWRSAPFLHRWMQQNMARPNAIKSKKKTRAPIAGESLISKKCKPDDFL